MDARPAGYRARALTVRLVVAACLVGGVIIFWSWLAPSQTPVDQFLDPRGAIAGVLLGTATVAALVLWLVAGRAGDGPRRRRGAWWVSGGTAVAYGAAVLAIASSSWSQGIVVVLLVLCGAALLGALAAAVWWNTPRAIIAALAGAWAVAVVASIYDIAWQLSGPTVAPFEWCVGGMDCIGRDPDTPLSSGWIAFGAFWGMLWFGGLMLAALGMRWMVEQLVDPPRPKRRDQVA